MHTRLAFSQDKGYKWHFIIAAHYEELSLKPGRTRSESRRRAIRSALRWLGGIIAVALALATGAELAERYGNPFSNYTESEETE